MDDLGPVGFVLGIQSRKLPKPPRTGPETTIKKAMDRLDYRKITLKIEQERSGTPQN